MYNKLLIRIALIVLVGSTAFGAERFATTIGTVHREIVADRVAFTVRVKAVDKSIESSNAKLERLLRDLFAEARNLKYSSNAFAIKSRSTEREWDWNGNKKTPAGFASSANLSVSLNDLENYGELMTFLGVTEGYEVVFVSLASSREGEARKQVITEALRAAREKAALLAEESGTRIGNLLEVVEEEADVRSFSEHPASANSRDPNEGKGVYPIGIYVKVRAKFELK